MTHSATPIPDVGRTSVRQIRVDSPLVVGINPDPQNRSPWAWPLFAAFVFLLTSPATQSAELGRLFFTPQERAQLERQGALKSAQPAARIDTLTVNGMIQKSGGKRIYWINGEQQDAVASPGQAPASVRVTVPGKPQPVEVKVGQRIELNPAQMTPAE